MSKCKTEEAQDTTGKKQNTEGNVPEEEPWFKEAQNKGIEKGFSWEQMK